MRLLDLIHAHLGGAGVSHALIGAAALAASGVARSTFDVDLLVVDRRCLDEAFWGPVRPLVASAEVRRGDRDDPLAGVARFEQVGDRPVDVIVGKSAWQQRALNRALQVPGAPPVVRLRDLVLLKLYAGGSQDLWDIRQVLALPDAQILVAEVEEDLADLPEAGAVRWRRILQEG